MRNEKIVSYCTIKLFVMRDLLKDLIVWIKLISYSKESSILTIFLSLQFSYDKISIDFRLETRNKKQKKK